MAEPVTIGGQTFIKTGDGWVDQKSKAKAPEGLLSLLNRLQVENSPEGKKKRVRIDTSRPVVKLGKTEYVWDLNSGIWIDKKTKDAANPAFSKLIEAAYQSIIQGTTEEEKLYESWAKQAAAGQVFAGMGAAGQAGKQKVRTRTGSGQLPAPNIKINSPIVQMIEKLATIDGYLKQRLDNQKKIANRNLVATKEAAIEAKSEDASPVEQNSKPDAEKSDATGIGVALLVGGLIAAQFEPVQEAFKSLASGIKSVFNFVGSVASTISDGLDFFTGGSSTSDSSTIDAEASIPNITQDSAPSSSNVAPVSLPSAPSQTNEAASSAVTEASSSAAAAQPNISRSAKPMTTSSGSRFGGFGGGGTGFNGGSASGKYDTPNATPSQSVARPKTTSAPSATPSPSSSPTSAPAASTPATPAPATTRPADATKQTEQVGSSKPSDILQFTARTGSEANFRGLPPSFQKALLTAGAEYKQTYGEKLIITSARRSPDEQQRLLDEKAAGRSPNAGGVVAGKYSSPHVKGTGVDIGQAGKAANILAKQGIIWQAIPGDEVHYNYKGPGAATDGFWGSDSAKDSVLGKIVSTGVDLTKGAIEAIGTIAQAAFGKQKVTTGSQLLDFNDTMSGNIAKAARDKTSAMVDSKTLEVAAPTMPTPISLSTSSSSSSMQGIQTESDKSNVEWYLTRMGFAKVNYEQTSHA